MEERDLPGEGARGGNANQALVRARSLTRSVGARWRRSTRGRGGDLEEVRGVARRRTCPRFSGAYHDFRAVARWMRVVTLWMTRWSSECARNRRGASAIARLRRWRRGYRYGDEAMEQMFEEARKESMRIMEHRFSERERVRGPRLQPWRVLAA